MTTKKGGARRSERVRKLIEGDFMKFHDEGLSISEIAEKVGVSKETIYDNLAHIAEKVGVTRDSLLMHPGKGNKTSHVRSYSPKNKVDKEKFLSTLSSIDDEMNALSELMDSYIEEEVIAEVAEETEKF